MLEAKIGMAFLRLLLSIGLISVTVTSVATGDDSRNETRIAVNYRLPDNVVPVRYNIKLVPYIEEDNFTFDGESSISIEIRRATRDISLHALDLTVDAAATSLINDDGVPRTPTAHNYSNGTQILVLNFNDELPPGFYILNMKFVGVLNNDLRGFFRTSYKNEKGDKVWLAATHFEATWARRAFPCWDEPALKATFDISIKHHRNYTALSNMPVREQEDDGHEDGMLWTRFDTTPVMSTYLVAFVVADYIRVPNANGNINMWCRSQLAPHATFAQEVAEISGSMLTWYTNLSEPVPKMDHVAVPELTASAMENWGLIIYQEGSFAYNEELDTTEHKHRIAVVAVHEMAHQWFGNIVSPRWWSYAWLNEGFASFFENYILNQIFDDWRMMDLFVAGVQQFAFGIDVAKNMMPVTSEVNNPKEIFSLFSYSSYGKAPVILRMLQHIISDEVFRNGLIKYLHTHQFSSATPDDLWSALQAALDESDIPHDDYKLKEVMDTWIKKRHYPVVHVTRNYDTGETRLMQEHFRPYKSSGKEIDQDKWWIPLTFTTQTNPNFTNTLPTHWLSPQDTNITINGIDPDDWIIVNLQQTGYYIVNYDTTNWRKITEYLNSDEYTKIHVLNRAQIISDAFHLMMENQLNITIFLDIVNYLSQETDYIPWYTTYVIFGHIQEFFKFPESEYFKPHLLKILDGLVKNVGYEEDPTEDDITKLKRTIALRWACTMGHSECKRMATVKLIEHLTDPETYKVLPNLKEWTYCMGMMEANASTWNKMMDVHIQKSTTEIVYYLICSEDTDILINFLNVSAANDSIIPKEIYNATYELFVIKHANNDAVLDYILVNLEKITSRGINMDSALNVIINNVHSKERLNKISKFVKSNVNDEKVLASIQKEIENRVSVLSTKYSTLKRIIGLYIPHQEK